MCLNWTGNNAHGTHYGMIIEINWCGLTLISAWISNYSHYKVWDEITYPFPNLKGSTIEVWQWISNFIPHFIMAYLACNYLSMLGLKSFWVSKKGPQAWILAQWTHDVIIPLLHQNHKVTAYFRILETFKPCYMSSGNQSLMVKFSLIVTQKYHYESVCSGKFYQGKLTHNDLNCL